MCAVRTYDYARLGPPPGAKVLVAGGCGGIAGGHLSQCADDVVVDEGGDEKRR